MQQMTSMQRVIETLNHREPDRVPFFLLLTTHGAKELGLGIREYFSTAANVVEGQLRMLRKYRHDCLYPFFYAALEAEAWGGEVVFYGDGPPNTAAPFLKDPAGIMRLHPPRIDETRCLHRVLEAIRLLKDKVGNDVPIIGVVMSPFSLPVMQMGFDTYLEVMFGRPDLFRRLMEVNTEFTVAWANAQFEAGATAVCYFDPVSSSTIIPRDTYLAAGFPVACSTIRRMNGPAAIHMASGRCLPIMEDLARTGAAAVGVSALEDLALLKEKARGRAAIFGNLNGVEMRTWSTATATSATRETIRAGGAGGGFILADNHGEIPWAVPEEVLLAISATVHAHGRYPLETED